MGVSVEIMQVTRRCTEVAQRSTEKRINNEFFRTAE